MSSEFVDPVFREPPAHPAAAELDPKHVEAAMLMLYRYQLPCGAGEEKTGETPVRMYVC